MLDSLFLGSQAFFSLLYSLVVSPEELQGKNPVCLNFIPITLN